MMSNKHCFGDAYYEKAIDGYNERPDAKFVVAVGDCYIVTLKDILTVNNFKLNRIAESRLCQIGIVYSASCSKRIK